MKAQEAKPVIRQSGFDPSEAGGHGLMAEMSVLELRQRLEMSKQEL